MTETSKSRGKRALFGLLFGLLCLCFGSASLFSLAQPVNVLAYWLGYGDAMQVVVTKGSTGSSFGRDGEPGEGRIVSDGGTVRLYGVRAGETVTARPRLIDLGAQPYAYHSGLRAAEDLVWLIPSALFGFPFALLILGVLAPQRLSRITRWLNRHSDKSGGTASF
ncbi:hypothetical protein APR12_005876 [Nocardia amikacinitolerans]|uniref:hypothetical protein n=1 Tax=Nocardia amikacinitolerans TaxID=756689 RepID=UPI00082AF419|nr:hypothetical protein [Nocardia amikacinitolerans]MCP2320494.1 hypothetical protein [Nocardia amikacinitolerans]